MVYLLGGEPGARSFPVDAALQRCSLQLPEDAVRQRLQPLILTFEEQAAA